MASFNPIGKGSAQAEGQNSDKRACEMMAHFPAGYQGRRRPKVCHSRQTPVRRVRIAAATGECAGRGSFYLHGLAEISIRHRAFVDLTNFSYDVVALRSLLILARILNLNCCLVASCEFSATGSIPHTIVTVISEATRSHSGSIQSLKATRSKAPATLGDRPRTRPTGRPRLSA